MRRVKRKGILALLVFSVAASAYGIVALAFVGPQAGTNNPPPLGNGAIGVDQNQNLSVGTPTTEIDTKFLVVPTGGNTHVLRVMPGSGSIPALVIRASDGHVGIATSTPDLATQVIQGSLWVTGTINGQFIGGTTPFNGSISASNVISDVFGRLQGGGFYAFPDKLGVGTSTQVGLPALLSVYATGTPAVSAYFAGNVGIGMSNPLYPLDVAGTINMTGFRMPTNAVSGHVLKTDANGLATWQIDATGLSGGQANYIPRWLSATTQGTSTMYQLNNNIGVGTTSPAYPLDVNGAMRLEPTTVPSGAEGVMYYDRTLQRFMCYEGSGFAGCTAGGVTGGGAGYIPVWSAGGITLVTSTIYQVPASKNLAVGTQTSDYSLRMWKEANASISLEGNTDNGAQADTAYLRLSRGSAGTVASVLGIISQVGFGPDGGSYSGSISGGTLLGTLSAAPLQLGTNNNARVTISATGNVGIGTITPNDNSGVDELVIKAIDASNDADIRLVAGGGGSSWKLRSGDDGNFEVTELTGSGGSSGLDRMVLTQSGGMRIPTKGLANEGLAVGISTPAAFVDIAAPPNDTGFRFVINDIGLNNPAFLISGTDVNDATVQLVKIQETNNTIAGTQSLLQIVNENGTGITENMLHMQNLSTDTSGAFILAENSAGSPLFYVGMNGNVGIGTVGPLSALDVRSGSIMVGGDDTESHLGTNAKGLFLTWTEGYDAAQIFAWDNTPGINIAKNLVLQRWGGNVTIGDTVPRQGVILNVFGGDIYNETPDKGLILTSQNGTCYLVKVTNGGTLTTSLMSCPAAY